MVTTTATTTAAWVAWATWTSDPPLGLPDGVTANDAGDGDTGANNLQNFPVLTSADGTLNSMVVSGTLNSTANSTFRLEFFTNAACDASGNGEGQFYLGSQDVLTDGSGNAPFSATVYGAFSAGQQITATATSFGNDTSEFSGGLYILPGTHKLGLLESVQDTSTAYKLWSIPKQKMIEVLRASPSPVPVVGRAGTAVLFHCNVLHASGHNLSAEDRWHIYISCNAVANAPKFTASSRPDWVVSRNTAPLPIEDDAGVTKAA